MNSRNDKESTGRDRTACIAGIFVVIGACITGVFLILNTLIEKGAIAVFPSPVPTTLIAPSPVPPTAEIPVATLILRSATNSPISIPPTLTFAPTTPTEILPSGVNNVSEMPDWLAANVGGIPAQWQRVQSGKWRFRAGNAGGVGDNQILSPKIGFLIFGADSGQKDSNGGVVWKEVSIGAGESTFWRCGEPNKPGPIDTADWVLFNPNIGTSCN